MNEPNTGNERTDGILKHVASDDATTRDCLKRLFFDESVSANAVTQVTSRLVDQQLLNRFELCRGFTYFRLGTKAVSLMRLPASHTTPIGEQQLTNIFAMLYFVTFSDCCRERLDATGLEQHYPGFPTNLYSLNWYHDVDDDGDVRLGLVYPSLTGHPADTIRKINRDLYEYASLPVLGSLISNQQFVASVVVQSEARQKQLEQQFAADPPNCFAGIFGHPRLAIFGT